MIAFCSLRKTNGPLVLLVIGFLSLLPFTVDGFLSNINPALSMHRKPQTQQSIRRPRSVIASPPSALITTRCESKRDPSFDGIDDDEDNTDQRSTGEIDEKMTGSIHYASDETPRGKNKNLENNDSGLSIPAALFATVLFVAFWPLLALLRSTSSPIDGFDIDMFLALKGIMETAPMTDSDPSIVELPSLSPAEQLVGAIFGPPR